MNKKQKLKGLFQSVLAGVMTASIATSSLAVNFVDTHYHWAETEIDRWNEEGVVMGYDGYYRPDNYIKRGDMAVILNKIMDYQLDYVSGSNPSWFPNVTVQDLIGNYYDSAIYKLHTTWMMIGTDSYVRPEDYITRQEAAIMLAKVFHLDTDYSGNTAFYDSSSISTWAKNGVYAMTSGDNASNTRYMLGRDGSMFEPQEPITRAEIAQVLDKMVAEFVQNPVNMKDTTINGNMVINTPAVSLTGVTIKGDLIISEGVADGDIWLTDVKVEGNIIIKGGSTNTIYVCGVTAAGMEVSRKDAATLVKLCCGTDIPSIEVSYDCVIDATELDDGYSVGDVTVNYPGNFESASTLFGDITSNVTIMGKVDEVVNNHAPTNLTLSGPIGDVTLKEDATINGDSYNKGDNVDMSTIPGTSATVAPNIVLNSVFPNGTASAMVTHSEPKLDLETGEVTFYVYVSSEENCAIMADPDNAITPVEGCPYTVEVELVDDGSDDAFGTTVFKVTFLAPNDNMGDLELDVNFKFSSDLPDITVTGNFDAIDDMTGKFASVELTDVTLVMEDDGTEYIDVTIIISQMDGVRLPSNNLSAVTIDFGSKEDEDDYPELLSVTKGINSAAVTAYEARFVWDSEEYPDLFETLPLLVNFLDGDNDYEFENGLVTINEVYPDLGDDFDPSATVSLGAVQYDDEDGLWFFTVKVRNMVDCKLTESSADLTLNEDSDDVTFTVNYQGRTATTITYNVEIEYDKSVDEIILDLNFISEAEYALPSADNIYLEMNPDVSTTEGSVSNFWAIGYDDDDDYITTIDSATGEVTMYLESLKNRTTYDFSGDFTVTDGEGDELSVTVTGSAPYKLVFKVPLDVASLTITAEYEVVPETEHTLSRTNFWTGMEIFIDGQSQGMSREKITFAYLGQELNNFRSWVELPEIDWDLYELVEENELRWTSDPTLPDTAIVIDELNSSEYGVFPDLNTETGLYKFYFIRYSSLVSEGDVIYFQLYLKTKGEADPVISYNIEEGTSGFTADMETAVAGTTVTLTPDSGVTGTPVVTGPDGVVEVTGPNGNGDYTFTMPEGNVTVTAPVDSNDVTVDDDNATLQDPEGNDITSAEEGDTVVVVPDENKLVDSVTVLDGAGNDISDEVTLEVQADGTWEFVMPDGAVDVEIVYQSFELTTILDIIDLPTVSFGGEVSTTGNEYVEDEDGNVTVVGGTGVSVTITPNENSKVGSVTYTDVDENIVTLTAGTSGAYTFTMPLSASTLTVSFVAKDAVEYTVTTTDSGFKADKNPAVAGATVTLTPDTGTTGKPVVNNGAVTVTGPDTAGNYTFTMPESNVTVTNDGSGGEEDEFFAVDVSDAPDVIVNAAATDIDSTGKFKVGATVTVTLPTGKTVEDYNILPSTVTLTQVGTTDFYTFEMPNATVYLSEKEEETFTLSSAGEIVSVTINGGTAQLLGTAQVTTEDVIVLVPDGTKVFNTVVVTNAVSQPTEENSWTFTPNGEGNPVVVVYYKTVLETNTVTLKEVDDNLGTATVSMKNVSNNNSEIVSGSTQVTEGQLFSVTVETSDLTYAIFVEDEEGTEIEGTNGVYVMPSSAVTVTVTYEALPNNAYNLISNVVPTNIGGGYDYTIVGSTENYVVAGETVRITPVDVDGYTFSLKLTEGSPTGTEVTSVTESSGVYSFAMPSSHVYVNLSYTADFKVSYNSTLTVLGIGYIGDPVNIDITETATGVTGVVTYPSSWNTDDKLKADSSLSWSITSSPSSSVAHNLTLSGATITKSDDSGFEFTVNVDDSSLSSNATVVFHGEYENTAGQSTERTVTITEYVDGEVNISTLNTEVKIGTTPLVAGGNTAELNDVIVIEEPNKSGYKATVTVDNVGISFTGGSYSTAPLTGNMNIIVFYAKEDSSTEYTASLSSEVLPTGITVTLNGASSVTDVAGTEVEVEVNGLNSSTHKVTRIYYTHTNTQNNVVTFDVTEQAFFTMPSANCEVTVVVSEGRNVTNHDDNHDENDAFYTANFTTGTTYGSTVTGFSGETVTVRIDSAGATRVVTVATIGSETKVLTATSSDSTYTYYTFVMPDEDIEVSVKYIAFSSLVTITNGGTLDFTVDGQRLATNAGHSVETNKSYLITVPTDYTDAQISTVQIGTNTAVEVHASSYLLPVTGDTLVTVVYEYPLETAETGITFETGSPSVEITHGYAEPGTTVTLVTDKVGSEIVSFELNGETKTVNQFTTEDKESLIENVKYASEITVTTNVSETDSTKYIQLNWMSNSSAVIWDGTEKVVEGTVLNLGNPSGYTGYTREIYINDQLYTGLTYEMPASAVEIEVVFYADLEVEVTFDPTLSDPLASLAVKVTTARDSTGTNVESGDAVKVPVNERVTVTPVFTRPADYQGPNVTLNSSTPVTANSWFIMPENTSDTVTLAYWNDNTSVTPDDANMSVEFDYGTSSLWSDPDVDSITYDDTSKQVTIVLDDAKVDFDYLANNVSVGVYQNRTTADATTSIASVAHYSISEDGTTIVLDLTTKLVTGEEDLVFTLYYEEKTVVASATWESGTYSITSANCTGITTDGATYSFTINNSTGLFNEIAVKSVTVTVDGTELPSGDVDFTSSLLGLTNSNTAFDIEVKVPEGAREIDMTIHYGFNLNLTFTQPAASGTQYSLDIYDESSVKLTDAEYVFSGITFDITDLFVERGWNFELFVVTAGNYVPVVNLNGGEITSTSISGTTYYSYAYLYDTTYGAYNTATTIDITFDEAQWTGITGVYNAVKPSGGIWDPVNTSATEFTIGTFEQSSATGTLEFSFTPSRVNENGTIYKANETVGSVSIEVVYKDDTIGTETGSVSVGTDGVFTITITQATPKQIVSMEFDIEYEEVMKYTISLYNHLPGLNVDVAFEFDSISTTSVEAEEGQTITVYYTNKDTSNEFNSNDWTGSTSVTSNVDNTFDDTNNISGIGSYNADFDDSNNRYFVTFIMPNQPVYINTEIEAI